MKLTAFDRWVAFLLKWEGGCMIDPDASLMDIYNSATNMPKTGGGVPHAGSGVGQSAGSVTQTGGSVPHADVARHMGVTLPLYELWRQMHARPVTTEDDLRRMCYDDWRSVLEAFYWERFRISLCPFEGMAVCMADGIMHGGTEGLRQMQRALGVEVTGVVDARTRCALRRSQTRYNARVLCDRLLDMRLEHLRSLPAYDVRGQRWEGRIEDLRGYVYNLDLTRQDLQYSDRYLSLQQA